MDQIFIKEEVDDDACDQGVVSSASFNRTTTSISSSFSIPPSSSSTNSFPPTQRVLPSTLPPRRGLSAPGFTHYVPGASEELSRCSKPPCLKRKCPEMGTSTSKLSRSPLSLMSPPLLPTGPSFQLHSPKSKIALVPGYQHDGGAGQEDEWKNIKVMLNCIAGMVEKTQSAINILQQRQTEVANIRNTEDILAEVQSRAHQAIVEVKQVALEEIKTIKKEKVVETQNDSKEESCWNCGRQATETCSGCSLARYCGPFCQHKDWENHSRLCRADLTMEEIPGKHPPPREREEK